MFVFTRTKPATKKGICQQMHPWSVKTCCEVSEFWSAKSTMKSDSAFPKQTKVVIRDEESHRFEGDSQLLDAAAATLTRTDTWRSQAKIDRF